VRSDCDVIAVLLERLSEEAAGISRVAREFGLTPREQETVELLRQGLENKQIAECMSISPYTVKAFLKAIMIKTGASTRSGILGRMFCSSTAGVPSVRPVDRR
jgi:DNA-binding CsgD family transcriptional regulator